MPGGAPLLLLVLLAPTLSYAWNEAKLPRTWSNRLGVTLTPVATGVWAAERPSYRLGVCDVGTRMAVLRASDGTLIVHSPVHLDDRLRRGIDHLGGGVSCIIDTKSSGRASHGWRQAYPEAAYFASVEDAGRSGSLTSTLTAVGITGIRLDMLDKVDSTATSRSTGGLTSERIDGRILDALFVQPWRVREPLWFFYHVDSRALVCGSSYWNYPTTDRPAGEGDAGDDGTGKVHACSKVPIEETIVPSANVPRRTRLWAAVKNRLLWPARRSIISQGGLNVGGWVLWTGGCPPGASLACYREQVDQLLGLECETIVPAHGDVLRGKEVCHTALRKHFLPSGRRSGRTPGIENDEFTKWDKGFFT